MGIFDFWLKTPANFKSCSKNVQNINLPYYLSHFIKKNPLFYVDLFSRTFDMKNAQTYAHSCFSTSVSLGEIYPFGPVQLK